MKLTAIRCNTAEPKGKRYKLADGGGLYLEILPNGSKSWRLKYRWLGKEKRLVIGLYPTVTLAKARKARDEAKLFFCKVLKNVDALSAFFVSGTRYRAYPIVRSFLFILQPLVKSFHIF